MRVIPVPALTDNYAYVLVTPSGRTAVVDPSEAAPVQAVLEREGLSIDQIWLTHHHWDHVGGVEALVDAFAPAEVLGSEYDLEHARIPRQTRAVGDGERFALGDSGVRVITVPGHTLGAIAYVIDDAVFTGDTLFLGGCGRVFEGTMPMMRESLGKLAELPDDTRVYCGHEYTVRNLEFAAHVEPANDIVRQALAAARACREAGEPTVPGSIGRERGVNPFMRSHHASLAQGLSTDASFASLRERKNTF